VFLTTWQPKLAGPHSRYGHGALPPNDLTMPGHRQRGMFSVENRSRADQRARQRAFFECGYTSFAVSGTGPRWMEKEHDTTTAKGNRRARGS